MPPLAALQTKLSWSSGLSNGFFYFTKKTMATRHLPNYLRTNRKRMGLSQDDVAYLLGRQSGTKICRYERFVRDPSLETALACEVIFHRPIRELFSGIFREVERKIAARARLLAHKTARLKPSNHNRRKCLVFEAIASGRLSKPSKSS